MREEANRDEPRSSFDLCLHLAAGKSADLGWAQVKDDEFLAAFEACTLPQEHFRHSDHVRMGFLYVSRYSGPEALQRFSDALQSYAAAIGKKTLYHETITWAFLLLIRERLARAGQQDGRTPTWEQFASANRDLLIGKDQVLRRYYSEEVLGSELARRTFLLPDRNYK